MIQKERRLQAVLFDFDGTLADSYAAITASVNHVRSQHGLEPLAEEQVRPHVGRGPDYLMQQTVPGTDPLASLAVYRAHHPSVMRSGTRLLPGAAESLSALRQMELRLGICSNKPVFFTRKLLVYLGLDEDIEAVFGPEDVPLPKPAPDMLLAALARFRVGPEEALYVGDMGIDIATARAAEVAVWVVPTGSDSRVSLEAAGPDRILGSLHELPGLVAPLVIGH
jgi:phosphoglycolate phosphatase